MTFKKYRLLCFEILKFEILQRKSQHTTPIKKVGMIIGVHERDTGCITALLNDLSKKTNIYFKTT